MKMGKRLKILIISDDPTEILWISDFLRQYQSQIDHTIINNYVDAANYLFQNAYEANDLNPHLILLDIAISNHKGIQLLQSLKQHTDLKKIPVLILSASKIAEDVQMSYDHHVSAFIQKPPYKEQYIDLLKIITEYWMKTVTLPEFAWS